MQHCYENTNAGAILLRKRALLYFRNASVFFNKSFDSDYEKK